MSAAPVTATTSRTGGPKLSETQHGVLLSSMGDASCGMTLGRSVAWVVRMRRELAAEEMPVVVACEPTTTGAGAVGPPPSPAVPAPLETHTVRPEPKPEARSPKPEARECAWC